MKMGNFLKIILTCLLTIDGIHCGFVRVTNNCGFSIGVGTRRNDGGPSYNFGLGSGQSRDLNFPSDGVGWRVWGQQDGDNGDFASLAEGNFERNDRLWYDISQVDGYNLPIQMSPMRNSGGRCESVSCNFNLDNCADKVYGGNGRLVACKNPNRDDGNTEYVRRMKRACPNTYTWSKDDQAGMRDCNPGNQGIIVRFC